MPLTPEQKAIRSSGIGGSDAAAICGRHPYFTPMSVWLSKLWGIEKQMTDAMRWGQRLEAVVAALAAEELGMTLDIPTTTFRHPTHPIHLANLDGILDGQEVLETKCINPWDGKELGEQNTDDIQRAHLYQVHHYMLVTGMKSARVAYLVGGTKLQLYRVESDPEFSDVLAETERDWWQRHIVDREEPAPTNDTELDEFIAWKHRSDNKSELAIGEDSPVMESIRRLKTAIDNMKTAESELTSAQLEVKSIMGAAATLTTPLGIISWKSTKRGSRQFLPRLKEDSSNEQR